MPRIVHFEIPAKEPEKVAAFYREVFDWNIARWDGPVEYWLVGTGEEGTPGIDGGLFTPDPGMHTTINTIDVPDLDDYLKRVTANGGQVVADKMPVPGVGWMAYCKDVEGTIFGMMQMDESVGPPAS